MSLSPQKLGTVLEGGALKRSMMIKSIVEVKTSTETDATAIIWSIQDEGT